MFRVSIAVAALIFSANYALAKSTDGDEADLSIRIGETVQMTINDQPVRFRIAPDAVSVPTVNSDAATRIGLKPSMIRYGYVIGPVTILFSTDNVRYREQDQSFRRRTAFSDRNLVDGADGVAGPATFPNQRTIMHLRDAQDGDRAITFRIDNEMGRSQTGVAIDVGGYPVYAAFSFDRAESLVTATGGRWIAEANGGRFDGEAREVPILYGVSRPVRPLSLERPLMLGELEIRNLSVRVSDMGNTRGIADGTTSEQDPNEIVVTADSKRKIPNQRMYIGMDTIGHCASITYDFEAGTITLMCPEQPPAVSMNASASMP